MTAAKTSVHFVTEKIKVSNVHTADRWRYKVSSLPAFSGISNKPATSTPFESKFPATSKAPRKVEAGDVAQ